MVTSRLAVVETHPVQYHAPVYREVQRLGIPVTAIYGSDFSVAGYRDVEFESTFAWDTDLLDGYASIVLARHTGGVAVPHKLSTEGLPRALRDARAAAVLLTGYAGDFHRGAWRAAERTRRPLLLRAETTDHAVQRSRWKAMARDAVLRRRYRRLTRALYIGNRSRAHYDRLGVASDRLDFSPYCVDTTSMSPGEEEREPMRARCRETLAIEADQVVLLFSGKLSARKGVDLIPEAVASLPPALRGHTVVLWLGDGAERARLRARSDELGVQARFVGFQPQRALSQYYHASDVLVMPSRHGETWGLVVNEALHHGLPCVVTSHVGCAPDLVISGETGEIAADDSVPALVGALSRCLQWRDNGETRIRCRGKVASYSIATAARGIATAFETAMRSPAARS